MLPIKNTYKIGSLIAVFYLFVFIFYSHLVSSRQHKMHVVKLTITLTLVNLCFRLCQALLSI